MPRESKQKEPIQQLADSVDLLLRLKIDSVKGDRSQKQMIHLLAGFGLEASEIARLLRLPATTVAPEVSKLRKPSKQKQRDVTSRRKPVGQR
jgi:DNA-directed RNA polymerase specialized sigma24 family protein